MKPKFYTFYICALIALLLLSAFPSALAGEFLYEDNFINLDPSWGTASETLSVKDGKLALKPALNSTQSVLNQSNVLLMLTYDRRHYVSERYKCTCRLRCTGGLNLLGQGLRQFLLFMHQCDRFFQN